MLTFHRALSRLPLQRGFMTLPGTNIKVGQDLSAIMDFFKMPGHLNTFVVMFFKASWNPQCEKTFEEYKEFANNHSTFQHFVVDCDKEERIRLYFGARYQPQFLVLLNGSPIERMIGYDLERLADILERVESGHRREFNYIEGSKDLKQNYFEQHDRYIRFVEAGRDLGDYIPESLTKEYLTHK